jgi:hypothetical protein
MIPDPHLHMLFADLARAISHALHGHWTRGYDCLLSGLNLARELQRQGKPWAAELVRRYEQVVDAFQERYGPRMD